MRVWSGGVELNENGVILNTAVTDDAQYSRPTYMETVLQTWIGQTNDIL